MIDVVTTAIRRPELLARAYRSYFEVGIRNLPPVRIILNIDPIGHGNTEALVQIAARYTSQVCVRIAETPNFARAINWAWSQVQSDYFLHLEDDWQLRHSIDFNDWKGQLDVNPRAMQAVLLRKQSRGGSAPYSFRPNLATRQVIQVVGEIPETMNPEKYVSNKIDWVGCSVDYGPAYAFFDLGRKWAKGHSLQKDPHVSGLALNVSPAEWFQCRRVSWLGRFDYVVNRLRWDASFKILKMKRELGL